ncbi:major capsid protein [Castellaniella sp. WN]
MSIGKASNFKVYQNELRGGIVETLMQASNYFNAAGGAIALTTVSRRGDYAKESFFTNIANLVTRRDTTSTSNATDLLLAMDEIISVKLNRKIGPVNQTYDAFAKIAMDMTPEAFSVLLGNMIGKAMQVEMLNSGLRSARSSLVNNAETSHTVATNGTMTTSDLVTGLSKFGDASSGIVAWVMHSKVWFDLVQHQIGSSGNGDVVSGIVVQAATPLSLNRPVIVTDSDALIVTGGAGSTAYSDYHTLGLTAQGIVLENSESERVVLDEVTGLENLVVRLQGEYAYNAGVKGFKWDTTKGANPNDATLGTGANWIKSVSDKKSLAGVVVKSR